MDDNRELIIGAIIIALSIILTAFLFEISGLQEMNPLSLASFDGIVNNLLTLPVILFALALPISFAIISALSHSKEKMFLYKTSYAGAFAGLILSLALFGLGFFEIIITVFYLISIMVLIETSYMKKQELKKMITFRTASAASHKAFLIIAIGLFLTTAVDGLENQEQYVEELGETIMGLAFAEAGGPGSSGDIIEISADLSIQNQKAVLESIISLPQFEALREKDDINVMIFVATMDNYNETIDSPESRAKVIEQIKQKQGKQQELLSFEFIREQSPMVDAMATYYWLVSAFSIFFIFLFFSNMIAGNLAGIYSAIIRKILETIEGQ